MPAQKKELNVVVGLGKTGLSCIRYLLSKGQQVAVTDSRIHPPGLDECNNNFPDVILSLGKFDKKLLSEAKRIILSPGVGLSESIIAKQILKGTSVIGDIELFALEVKKPVIAITGSNAKSTVTTLVTEMAERSGIIVAVGGNIGKPALELLQKPNVGLFILELSSFQLETTFSLKPDVACILNITEDHMDRYASFADYIATKQCIYQQCKKAIFNRQDTNTFPPATIPSISFGSDRAKTDQFGLSETQNGTYLSFGDENLMPTAELKMVGQHNWENALAALAIGKAAGFEMTAMLEALREFKGLPHRCQVVAEQDGLTWYNDSKATNVGATIAAIEGIGSNLKGKVILIAGGEGKDANFSDLKEPVSKYVRSAILFGRDSSLIEQSLDNIVSVESAKDLKDAVSLANAQAKAGDAILFSPACASFDMFQNFEHRGETFISLVKDFNK